ncbi:MAG: hypothetical protein ACLTYW_01120 [Collinsella sp.]
MLASDGHAAINRGLGNIDGARRQTTAPPTCSRDREGIARGDDIAPMDASSKLSLTGPVQVTLDAGRIGVIVGRKYVSCGVRAGERRRGKRGIASAMSANRMVSGPMLYVRWVAGVDCRA